MIRYILTRLIQGADTGGTNLISCSNVTNADTSYCCDHTDNYCCDTGVGRFDVEPAQPQTWATWNTNSKAYVVVGTMFQPTSTAPSKPASTTVAVTTNRLSSIRTFSDFSSTATSAATSTSLASTSVSAASTSSGLSLGVKVGIGIGVGLGVLSIATITVLGLLLCRRRRKSGDEQANQQHTVPMVCTSSHMDPVPTGWHVPHQSFIKEQHQHAELPEHPFEGDGQHELPG